MRQAEIQLLRELAKEKAEISMDERNRENRDLWICTNDLHMKKPPVYIDEICWNEMNVDEELTLRTEDEFCRKLELQLRKEIYLWKHLPGNMVVNPYMDCPVSVRGGEFDDAFGISESVITVQADKTSDVKSRHFNIQIKDEEDIEKLKDPVVTVDEKDTSDKLEKMQTIFDDILEVRLCGERGKWFTPWDYLIRLTSVEPILYDLIERPEYVKALVKRFTDLSLKLMEQYNELGLWASNNNNTRVGSGGYGYTEALPAPEGLDRNASTKQLWGCGNAQIFSTVSQEMHWEFSLEEEIRWMSHFGLNYYGCCEPLHYKMDILKKIPNLRKISASPWCRIGQMAEIAGKDYVMSCKPSPAIFSGGSFHEETARRDVRNILEQSRGCNIEIVLKDLSTVDYKPQNLWRWNEIAREEIDRMYA